MGEESMVLIFLLEKGENPDPKMKYQWALPEV